MPLAESALELELKFAVPADKAQAVWRAIAPKGAESAEEKRLVSTYFDTADRRLARAGYGLRVRADGRRRVQTLKGPDPLGFARAEYEAAVRGPGVDLEALAATPAAGLLGGGELAPLFRVDVRRRKADIIQGAAVIEVCLDLGALEAEGRKEAISEIELELKSGSPKALFALARRLTAHRPLTLAMASKAERGYRLIGDEEPKAPTVGPHMNAGDAFTAIGLAALEQITGAAAALDAEITPKSVHALRVGIRRLRSARSAFKAMLTDRPSLAIAADLRWLAGSLDEMRDLDVLAHSAADADPAFHAALEKARDSARARLVETLGAPRARALPLKLAEWLAVGGWRASRLRAVRTVREQPLLAFAAHALDRRLRKLGGGAKLADLAPHERHERRIRIKKLRYAAEAFAPTFEAHPKRRRKLIAALKEAQEALGALNDDTVGRVLAQKVVGGDAEAAFAAGAAFAPDAKRDAKRLKAAQGAWRNIHDATPFWR